MVSVQQMLEDQVKEMLENWDCYSCDCAWNHVGDEGLEKLLTLAAVVSQIINYIYLPSVKE